MEKSKVIVVGGGLAGLTTAIHLSKTGLDVTVIEKNEYPKHKVCGEYISNEVQPYLEWLGVDISTLKPASISKIIFSTVNGKIINGNLPLGGFGVSRYAFDDYLRQKAVDNGCRFIQETVEDIQFEREQFTVTASNDIILKSDIVIGAFGKRSNIDQKMHRHFILKKSPWLAVKAHYSGDFPDDAVGLYNFKGGYCGVSKVENNEINICYLADFKTFKNYKNIEDYQREVLSANPHLKNIFDNMTSIFEKPLTISQISFDKKEAVENHVLMVGDSVGMIHPFCGNGMAMAIHSAKIVSELVGKYYLGEIKSRFELERKYKEGWDANFEQRLSTGRFLAKILRRPKLSDNLMRILMMFPSLFPKIISRTHGNPIILNS